MKDRVAIIDPVGSKAGMDLYSSILLKGLQEDGFEVKLYSNYTSTDSDVPYSRQFYNTEVGKARAIASNFRGFISSLTDAKKNKCRWLILHVFRGGLFDFFTFSLARLMGFRLLAIVHDIESLDTITLPFIRRSIIKGLAQVRVVHNQFSKTELFRVMQAESIPHTHVIPHVNYTSLFSHLQQNQAIDAIRQDSKKLSPIHPALPSLMSSGKPLLLFFGQIKKAKGLKLLLEAMPQCKEKFHLLVAGKVRDESWEKYEETITVFNLHDQVKTLIRHISDAERDVLFACAEGIVIPYTRIYQSGVLIMAMSFPQAVIASDLEPNRDLLQDDINGLLFRSNDSRDLARQLDNWAADAQKRKRLREQALIAVEKNCGYQQVGRHFAAVLRKYN